MESWGNGSGPRFTVNVMCNPLPLTTLATLHNLFRSSHRRLYAAATINLWLGVTVLSLKKSGCHSPCFYAYFCHYLGCCMRQSGYKEINTCNMLEKYVFINEHPPPKIKYKHSVSLRTSQVFSLFCCLSRSAHTSFFSGCSCDGNDRKWSHNAAVSVDHYWLLL